MPDLTIIKCYTCQSNEFWQKVVKGQTTSYVVSYTSYSGWHCNCPAFIFGKVKGNCKHINQVKDERCGWNWEAYTGSIGKPNNGHCPECNGPVKTINVGV